MACQRSRHVDAAITPPDHRSTSTLESSNVNAFMACFPVCMSVIVLRLGFYVTTRKARCERSYAVTVGVRHVRMQSASAASPRKFKSSHTEVEALAKPRASLPDGRTTDLTCRITYLNPPYKTISIPAELMKKTSTLIPFCAFASCPPTRSSSWPHRDINHHVSSLSSSLLLRPPIRGATLCRSRSP